MTIPKTLKATAVRMPITINSTAVNLRAKALATPLALAFVYTLLSAGSPALAQAPRAGFLVKTGLH